VKHCRGRIASTPAARPARAGLWENIRDRNEIDQLKRTLRGSANPRTVLYRVI
jgi:hypothetical protein